MYRAGRSVETELLRAVKDVVMALCEKRSTVFISLDISAAFDKSDVDTLLNRVYVDFRIGATNLFIYYVFYSQNDYVNCCM